MVPFLQKKEEVTPILNISRLTFSKHSYNFILHLPVNVCSPGSKCSTVLLAGSALICRVVRAGCEAAASVFHWPMPLITVWKYQLSSHVNVVLQWAKFNRNRSPWLIWYRGYECWWQWWFGWGMFCGIWSHLFWSSQLWKLGIMKNPNTFSLKLCMFNSNDTKTLKTKSIARNVISYIYSQLEDNTLCYCRSPQKFRSFCTAWNVCV